MKHTFLCLLFSATGAVSASYIRSVGSDFDFALMARADHPPQQGQQLPERQAATPEPVSPPAAEPLRPQPLSSDSPPSPPLRGPSRSRSVSPRRAGLRPANVPASHGPVPPPLLPQKQRRKRPRQPSSTSSSPKAPPKLTKRSLQRRGSEHGESSLPSTPRGGGTTAVLGGRPDLPPVDVSHLSRLSVFPTENPPSPIPAPQSNSPRFTKSKVGRVSSKESLQAADSLVDQMVASGELATPNVSPPGSPRAAPRSRRASQLLRRPAIGSGTRRHGGTSQHGMGKNCLSGCFGASKTKEH